MSYPRTEGERRRRNKILPYSRAPVSVKRLIDSGLPHHELAPHPGAQEVSDERTADRETDERTQVAANQSIRRISDQIHDEENQRQLMPPSRPSPQAPGRQRARRSDREHQGHGPETHAPKGDAGRGVETPHRLPRPARGEERHATDAGDDGAECKEATQGHEACWRTGHAGSGGKVGAAV